MLAGWLWLGSYLAGIQVSPSLLCAGPQTRCVTPGSSETPGLPEEARLCRCRRRSWKVEGWGPTPGGEPSAIGRQWPFADVCRNKLWNERRLSDPRFRSSRARLLLIDPLPKLLLLLSSATAAAVPHLLPLLSPTPSASSQLLPSTQDLPENVPMVVAEQHSGTTEASNGFCAERGPVIGGGGGGSGGRVVSGEEGLLQCCLTTWVHVN